MKHKLQNVLYSVIRGIFGYLTLGREITPIEFGNKQKVHRPNDKCEDPPEEEDAKTLPKSCKNYVSPHSFSNRFVVILHNMKHSATFVSLFSSLSKKPVTRCCIQSPGKLAPKSLTLNRTSKPVHGTCVTASTVQVTSVNAAHSLSSPDSVLMQERTLPTGEQLISVVRFCVLLLSLYPAEVRYCYNATIQHHTRVSIRTIFD